MTLVAAHPIPLVDIPAREARHWLASATLDGAFGAIYGGAERQEDGVRSGQ